MIDQQWKDPEQETQRLMELLGHTPLEVAVGALIGLSASLFWHWIR